MKVKLDISVEGQVELDLEETALVHRDVVKELERLVKMNWSDGKIEGLNIRRVTLLKMHEV